MLLLSPVVDEKVFDPKPGGEFGKLETETPDEEEAEPLQVFIGGV